MLCFASRLSRIRRRGLWLGPGESSSEDAFHGDVIRGTGRSDAHSEVELPLRSEIDVERRKKLLLLISEQLRPSR